MPVRRPTLATAIALAFATTLQAQARDTTRIEDLVVTATRTPTAARALGSASDLLKPAELARRQITTLREALSLVPGGATFVTGGSGGVTSLFLRGAASTQTLLLVDGIRINDANANSGSFLGGADLGGLGRLEVVRGPQSTLYGGAAIGGVVAMEAARGAGEFRGGASLEGGSFGSWASRAEASGSRGRLGLNTAFSAGATDNQRLPNGWDQRTQLVRLDAEVSDRFRIAGTFRGLQQGYTSPGDIRTPNTTPVDRSIFENNLGTLVADARFSARWSSHLVLGSQETYTRNTSSYDGGPESVFTLGNRRYTVDWQQNLALGAALRLVAGLNREWNTVRTGGASRDERLFAVYAEAEMAPLRGLNLTAGARDDDFSTFGHAATGRVTAAWAPGAGATKLRASYGSGFMPPSLSARYGSAFEKPNPAIRPERSRGWDAGIDQELAGGSAAFGLTVFRNSLVDLIGFRSAPYPEPGQEVNIDRARTRGVEASARVASGPVEARVAYTWLEAKALGVTDPSAERLIRRPRHSLSADLVVAPDTKTTLGAGVVAVVDRQDTDFNAFPAIRVDPGSYLIARAHAARVLGRRLSLRARVENLFDRKYEPVYGFPAPGRTVIATAALSF